ncbi:MAG: hypothetical protein HKN37_14145, partial [Rhodothermales bacterium]|nr:hypothetical protein [Rhodothermales bacterium]
EVTLRWDTPGDLPFPMPVDVDVDGTTRRVSMEMGSAQIPLTELDTEPAVDPLNWILKDEG